MRTKARAVARSSGTPARKRGARRRTDTDGAADGLLGLQASAGNAAVSMLVQRQEDDGGGKVVGTREESSKLYEQGTAALDAGRYDEAVRIFSSLLAGRYHHRETLALLVWNLALAKANLGDFDGAFDLAITYGHYGAGRADEQKLLEAVEQVREGISGGAIATPRTKADASALYERASAALDAGKYDEAAGMFETLLASPVEHDKVLPTIVWSLALAKANLGDFDRAYDLALQYGRFRAGTDERALLQQIDDLRQGADGSSEASAVPKTLDEATALYEKATSLFRAGQYEQAKGLYETLLASPVKRSEALPTIVWSLALCRANLGDFDGARRLALTYTQYRGTADDERLLFERIEVMQQRVEAGAGAAPTAP
jgi:outer membrane protein assembly factor BamD (BamD/ComL family)